MDVLFPYRDQGIGLSIPDDVEIFQPAVHAPVGETYHAIIKRLLRPLGYKKTLFDMAKRCNTACLVVDVFCPPEINRQIVDPIIKTLHAAGMAHNDITVLVTSEYPAEFTEDRVQSIFDDEFRSEYNVQTHNVFSYTKHELVGSTPGGIPVFIDRRFKDADIKIVTGSLYPHYLFGYSGAPLLLTLGLCGPETIQNLYNLTDVDNLAELNLLDENSAFYKELQEIFRISKIDFIVDVAMDREQRIIDVFSGKPSSVAAEFVERFNAAEFNSVPERADIVISSTGSSHLESSWYHNLMGLCFSHSFLQPNGTIIFVTPIFEQFPESRLAQIERKADLIELFELEKVINGTREKMFSCMDDGIVIVVSPQHGDRSLQKENQTVYFCSSVDKALEFAKEHAPERPRTLLLPDGLQTFVRLQT
jgi:nickel-dependent lactate racemase